MDIEKVEEKNIVIKSYYPSHHEVVLTNSGGDTFTFNPIVHEGLMDFLQVDCDKYAKLLQQRDELLEENEEFLNVVDSWKDVYTKYGIGGGGKQLYDKCKELSYKVINKIHNRKTLKQ